jgi:hypothetical protein
MITKNHFYMDERPFRCYLYQKIDSDLWEWEREVSLLFCKVKMKSKYYVLPLN